MAHLFQPKSPLPPNAGPQIFACLVCGLEAEEQLHKTGADLAVVQQVGGYAVICDVLWLLWDLACHLILFC